MKAAGDTTILFEALEPKLAADDDRAFWRAALSVLAAEFAQRYAEESRRGVWAMVVGACSQWVRPPNRRSNTAAGFMYPEGYKNSVPELDWSVIFIFRNRQWELAEKLPGNRIKVFRVAIPARTARHKHAAIHARWTPGGETVLYGFRKISDKWKCVAASDERLRGGISLNT
jgi:hypothetical protein